MAKRRVVHGMERRCKRFKGVNAPISNEENFEGGLFGGGGRCRARRRRQHGAEDTAQHGAVERRAVRRPVHKFIWSSMK